MKKKITCILALCVLMAGCGQTGKPAVTDMTDSSLSADTSAADTGSVVKTTEPQTEASETTATETATEPVAVQPTMDAYGSRPVMLRGIFDGEEQVTPTVSYQMWESDLSNVYFGGYEYIRRDVDYRKKLLELLGENGFALEPSYYDEYFQLYEGNRYALEANYVTVDSLMHTYHLYFEHLLRKTEEKHLTGKMDELSKYMLQKAEEQYNALKGTEWEQAAKTNLAFFTVGRCLSDPGTDVPSDVADIVSAELAMIDAAEGVAYTAIFDDTMEDYSQYKPRGYYDSTEQLKKYFKSMMWYGRMGFRLDKDDTARGAVLMTMALDGDALARWQEVYSVTSFFAGAADDIGYYEMRSVIDAVYGKGAAVTDLVGDDTRWQQVMQLNKDLPAPQINSVPGWASDSDEEHDAAQKGFRFMGQRFSVDEACFTQLVYRQVKENPDRPEDEQKRLLPDMLDVPAAFGSDTALDILTQQGSTDYPNFDEQMTKVRDTVTNAPSDTWESSLYSAWLHTLSPILDVKDESYPPFMRTDAWRRKSLMSFGGSYTELKHDTILYSKQVMGEMGGGELEEYDDRGYVEPEPLVYSRLQKLVAATSSGLDGFGMLSEKDKEELGILSELAGRLQTISRKELTGELPTDDEFELIRTYGGQLEHFWLNIMDERYPDEDWHSTQEHPAAIVADIATDPNGRCLEVGTGSPMTIYVLVEVDGQLKLATGVTYSFYEFTQLVSDRLTDKEWRRKIGIDRSNDAGEYTGDEQIDKSITYPWWYSDLVFGERY